MLLFYFTKAKSKIQEATLRFNTNHSPTRCFSSFPHIVSARHISPSVYNCFRNAEVVWFFFFFSLAFMRRKSSLAAQISSCQPVSQGPSDWFCSSDTCHPVSSLPEVCFLSPLSPYKDWGLGLTGYCYIPTYLFLSRSLPLPPHKMLVRYFFFLNRNRIPFVAWGGKKSLGLGNDIYADMASFLPQRCEVQHSELFCESEEE